MSDEEQDGDVVARVVTLIRRSAKLLESDEEFPADRDLLELGVDSFGLLELITDLEEEFDIAIPDEMLTRETFRSADSVTRAVHWIRVRASA